MHARWHNKSFRGTTRPETMCSRIVYTCVCTYTACLPARRRRRIRRRHADVPVLRDFFRLRTRSVFDYLMYASSYMLHWEWGRREENLSRYHFSNRSRLARARPPARRRRRRAIKSYYVIACAHITACNMLMEPTAMLMPFLGLINFVMA